MGWLEHNMWYLIAAVIVLAVVILSIQLLVGSVGGRRGSRLAVSEYCEVDKIRRLVLVRRDGIEHLIMIGGKCDLVIETGIAVYAPSGRATRAGTRL